MREYLELIRRELGDAVFVTVVAVPVTLAAFLLAVWVLSYFPV